MRTPFLFVAFLVPVSVCTAEPFRYPEATHGKGSLKYVNDVPVLTIAGSHAEMGEQMGQLAVRHVANFPDLLRQAIEVKVGKIGMAAALIAGKSIFDRYPKEFREEIESMAKASGVDLGRLIVANTISDLEAIFGCAGLIIEPKKSATGGILFGRNLDIPPVKGIHQYSLIVIFRPTGQQPFAAVTMPGFVGVGAGMNAAGLCIGGNTVTDWADHSPKSNPKGISGMLASRFVMQECKSLDEMEAWLKTHPMMAPGIVPSCDLTAGSIFEVTTKTVKRFPSQGSVSCATNQFQSDGLKTLVECHRLAAISKAKSSGTVTVKDVFGYLNDANQAAATMQTMIFEPKAKVIHVAFGDGIKPATAFPLRRVDVSELLKQR